MPVVRTFPFKRYLDPLPNEFGGEGLTPAADNI